MLFVLTALFLEGFAVRMLLRKRFTPLGHLDGIREGQLAVMAAEDLEIHRAVRILIAHRVHKVDGRIADEVGDEQVVRTVVDRKRSIVLLQEAVLDQADLGGQGHGFHLVMRDVDKCAAGRQVQTLKFGSHLQTKLRIQVRKRLVHENDLRFGRQCTGDSDTLLLSAGKFRRVALHEGLDLDERGNFLHALFDLLFGVGLHVLQTEGDVLIHRHVRPQCVVLEQEADLSLVGRDVDALLAVEDDLVADLDTAAGRRLKACDHTKRRGLAASGRSKKRDEGAVIDGEIQMVYRVEGFPAFRNIR